jgi:hypothetical protein
VILNIEGVNRHPAVGLRSELLQLGRTLRATDAGEHAPAIGRVLANELETETARGASDQYGGQDSSPWTSNDPSIYALHPALTNPPRLGTTP